MRRFIFIIMIFSFAVHGVYSENSNAHGVILELTGNVDLKPAGSSSYTRAGIGDEVAFNTIISTGFKSSAVIAVGNSTITIQPLSQLSISDNSNINLQTGRIIIESNELASDGAAAIFTVQSPGTSSSVRGTNFEFNTVNMKAKKGRVSFSGISGPAVIVQEGREDALGDDKKPAGSSSAVCSLPAAPGGNLGGSSSSGGGGSGVSGGGGASGGGGSCCD